MKKPQKTPVIFNRLTVWYKMSPLFLTEPYLTDALSARSQGRQGVGNVKIHSTSDPPVMIWNRTVLPMYLHMLHIWLSSLDCMQLHTEVSEPN